jgi:hypothetical protein
VFFYDEGNPAHSSFICNSIRDPSTTKELLVSDPEMGDAHCMDLDSFRAYSEYVFKLRNALIGCKAGN